MDLQQSINTRRKRKNKKEDANPIFLFKYAGNIDYFSKILEKMDENLHKEKETNDCA